MEIKLRQRLIGGAILVALAIIFIPLLLFKNASPTANKRAVNTDIPSLPPKPATPQSVTTVQYNGSSDQQVVVKPPAPQATVATSTPKQPTPQKSVIPAKKTAPAAKPVAKAKPVTAKAKGNWLVQVGIFTNAANVKKLQKKLEAHGYTVYKRTLKSASGTTMTRVLIGPGAQHATAMAIRAKLSKDMHIKGTLIALDSTHS